MKLEKRITLTAYEVEYIDTREPKPRTIHWEQIVLDGGRLSALARLGQTPAASLHSSTRLWGSACPLSIVGRPSRPA